MRELLKTKFAYSIRDVLRYEIRRGKTLLPLISQLSNGSILPLGNEFSHWTKRRVHNSVQQLRTITDGFDCTWPTIWNNSCSKTYMLF